MDKVIVTLLFGLSRFLIGFGVGKIMRRPTWHPRDLFGPQDRGFIMYDGKKETHEPIKDQSHGL